ncbi:hypothetical protein OA92_07295 [Marinomonas sp. SBI22]|nr:hypothetical protein OA92_07295 [Marinomonas sp. SBI22]
MYSISECGVTLEVLDQNHIPFIYKGLNNEKLATSYPIKLPYTHMDATSYVDREMFGRSAETRYSFAILKENNFVGICAIYDVNKTKGFSNLYYWVETQYWNLGIASIAVNKLLKFAKNELNLTHIESGVLKRNHASYRVLEKNGFIVENSFINKGKYHRKFLGEIFLEMKLNLQKHPV